MSGLYDLNPNKVGQVNNYFTLASDYGEQIEHWNGIDVTVNARLGRGVLVQGGVSTGKTMADNCDLVAKIRSLAFGGTSLGAANTNVWLPQSYCHQESPFLTQVKFLGVFRASR